MHWPAVLFAFGGLHVIAYCVVVRYRVPPRQPIPGHYRAVAWIGIAAMMIAIYWAAVDVIRP